jgi:Xaa-Pro aminopeptidase
LFDDFSAIQSALAEADIDGWLLFDFRGINPIASGLLSLEGMTTRRFFVWIPRAGVPVAVTHAIEQGPWLNWPAGWKKVVYSSWRSLESELRNLVDGKTVAMEYSPGDAVPYLDRVPAGVIEMVRAAGAKVVTSADLVSRFFAAWGPEGLKSHLRAAEAVAAIATDAMRLAGQRAYEAKPMTEYELASWIRDKFAEGGLASDHGPIVAIGPNAANPHYEPAESGSAPIRRGDVLLLDVWAREDGGMFADQTWMGSLGEPSARNVDIWNAVRDGRDAAIALLRERITSRKPVRGGEVDDTCRAVIESRGYGDGFIHRTGHSIDPRELHGSGPHLDNLETREERVLIPGVGFSIEPGVYLTGDVGIRSEVNAYVGDGELIVTPRQIQRELIIV